jgi:hypothetical protein
VLFTNSPPLDLDTISIIFIVIISSIIEFLFIFIISCFFFFWYIFLFFSIIIYVFFFFLFFYGFLRLFLNRGSNWFGSFDNLLDGSFSRSNQWLHSSIDLKSHLRLLFNYSLRSCLLFLYWSFSWFSNWSLNFSSLRSLKIFFNRSSRLCFFFWSRGSSWSFLSYLLFILSWRSL